MTIPGTEAAMVVDANVFCYVQQFEKHHTLPSDLPVHDMFFFCSEVLARYPIAVNAFIKTEYGEAYGGPEFVKFWIKRRAVSDLAIEVPPRPIPPSVKATLRSEFRKSPTWISRDGKYLATASNTQSGRLVTQNTTCFFAPSSRPHRRRRLDRYVRSTLHVSILTIDECCALHSPCE